MISVVFKTKGVFMSPDDPVTDIGIPDIPANTTSIRLNGHTIVNKLKAEHGASNKTQTIASALKDSALVTDGYIGGIGQTIGEALNPPVSHDDEAK